MQNLKQEIKILASSIMFALNDEECEKIAQEFEHIQQQLSLIDQLDVGEIQPTNFINRKILIDQLDNDQVQIYFAKDVFSNSKNFKDNYVVIKNEK